MNYRIRFYLRYHTHYGQDLFLLGNLAALGNDLPEKAIPMKWLNEEWWYADVLVAATDLSLLQYQYLLKQQSDTHFDGIVRQLKLPATIKELVFIDNWMDAADPRIAGLSAPFAKVFFQRPVAETANGFAEATHLFRVHAPFLPTRQVVCLVGNQLPGGNWNTREPVLLQYDQQGWFSAPLDLSAAAMPFEYKYGIYDLDLQQFVKYEEGENRILNTAAAKDRQVVLHDGYIRVETPQWKGAGVAIPVFSIRTPEGFGTGEFSDLPALGRWAKANDLQLIQLLPVNDTTQTHTWTDSYPYAAISSFAMHPLYIRLEEVGRLPDSHPLQKQFDRLRKWLNEREFVEYETVTAFKQAYLKALHSQLGAQLQTETYWEWFSSNESWLLPYAVFSFLRDKYKTNDFQRWEEHQVYDADAIHQLMITNEAVANTVHYHCFVQYHLHLQLKKATETLHQMGIALKGDLPIGVAKGSADVWVNPSSYHLTMQAGAPPDGFAAEGQNWGFPTYNWKQMLGDGLSWWQQRLKHMAVYFDAFRIDHILGFFRIWQIPGGAVSGILGYFDPAIPVVKEEFIQRGIDWNEDRFCEPFITEEILEEHFGNYAGMIRAGLMEISGGRYRLLPAYATQRLVQQSSLPAAVKNILLQLQTDVLFIKAIQAGKTVYHPRYRMEETRSFAALKPYDQAQLRSLYNNYFHNRQENIWRKEALKKLPVIRRATNMLICGEDLGPLPHCLPEVLRSLGVLSLEVERMPKKAGQQFTDIRQANYLSVLTPSTHDMSTLRGWWQEDPAITNNYYRNILGLPGNAPQLPGNGLVKEIIQRHRAAPAMWRIFQVQDLLAASGNHTLQEPDSERINIPANTQHYWRYRVPHTFTLYEQTV